MANNSEKAVYTGVLECEKGVYTLASDINGNVLVLDGELPFGCRVGDKVCAVEDCGVYKVVKSFGSADEAEANIKALFCAERLDEPFDFDSLMQAKQTAFTEITALMGRRVDLRGKTVITLSESENSRSECGFSIETDKAGNFVLGLHTMDVAEFIGEDSALEHSAYRRGKTVVLPDKEIPMLPEALTKGPCFFEVGQDRLAVSYFVTINEEGTVLSFDFCESIVKTAANCLFDEIEALILDFDSSAIMPLREAYASITPTINQLFVLGGILQNARVLNGGADIDRAERKFVYGRHGGKPVGVISQKESDPKRLIREFLAIVGRELAMYLNSNNIPALYRVQAAPDESAVADFRNKAEALGIDLSGVSGFDVFSYAAECSHGTRSEELLLKALHASLKETGFAAQPMRHVVHGTYMYVRFAYPMNRFADYCTQRIVKAIIAAREQGTPINRELMAEKVEMAIEAANVLEKRASRIENKVEDIVAMECLRKIGQRSYTGLVSGVNEKEIEVLLDNGCVGYIDLAQRSYAEYKDGTVTTGGQVYSFGSDVTVRFDRADFKAGKLYLTL